MSSSSSSPPPPGAGAPQVPHADCTVDSAGGVTFDVALAAADAALVLRRRGGAPGGDVRLPLTPVPHGRLRAVLPSTVDLPEGHWEAHVYAAGGADLTVRPGVSDLRALLDRTPDPHHETVAVRIPYAAADGSLAVRSWRRTPHAEAGDLTFRTAEAAMTVEGRLYGAELGPGAVVEARLRGDRGRIHREPVTGGAHSFAFTLPYAPLAEGRDGAKWAWDLWLTAAADAPAIRVARLLDDVAHKQSVFTYPALPVGDDGKTVGFPYYTLDNDLTVQVSTP
ncbi:transferase [Streptomyces sp. NPDC058657]|uniref:transferase n=1 Tax=unclassified Streptomyces TaxID=2593676 RepID=UPI00364D8FDE